MLASTTLADQTAGTQDCVATQLSTATLSRLLLAQSAFWSTTF
jgi:hypothetical protein